MAPGFPASPTTRSKPQKVSPQHTLERVRNNQRQHRARRRAYIETLEKKLGEAEQTILALRNQVEALQTEHKQCHHRNVADCRTPPEPLAQPHDDTSPPSLCGTHGTTFRDPGPLPDMTDRSGLTLLSPPPTKFPIGLPVGMGHRSERDAAIPAPDLMFSTTSHQAALGNQTQLSCGSSSKPRNLNALDEMAVARSHQSPLLMPDCVSQSAMEAYFIASGVSESTMLCSEAYSLISQQNFKGIRQEDVVTWLWGGFRKSLQPGGGCRVNTDILFSLLVFISEG